MPSHQDRRDPLPPGYQFGDARESTLFSQREYDRRYVESAVRRMGPPSWHVHVFSTFNPTVMADFCHCGARRDRPWNVIEGEEHD